MFLQHAKSFYKSYSTTFWFLICYSTILVYPTIVNWANQAPPENQLHWISAKVVFAQRDHPNLRVLMPDGSTRDFDFYADLTNTIRGLPRFAGATNQDLSKLQGCQAEIGVTPIRWLILPHNERVWEVRCKSFSLPYEKLISVRQSSLKYDVWIEAVEHGFFVLIISTFFIGERRKKWALRSTYSQ